MGPRTDGCGVAALLLLLVLATAGQVAAFNCPGGIRGADQVTGYSAIFGAQSDDGRPVKYVDQVAAWKKWGPVKRVALYFSWNAGCLQGVRVSYGDDARSAQTLGLTKDLATKEIALGQYEVITRVDVRENSKGDCIGWIKLSTNATNSVALGNEGISPEVRSSTINRWFGFLAAVRGYEQFRPEGPGGSTTGPLQQLQFVWGVAVCPDPPAEPARPSSALLGGLGASGGGGNGGARELGSAVNEMGKAPADSGSPAAGSGGSGGAGGQLCPSVRDQCNVAEGRGPASCPAIAPFTSPECVGGCCVSSGRCRSGFCGRAGLGTEVMSPDLLCWGTNAIGPHSLNRCRNLACKLAVPGCVGDMVSGACVGTVVALSVAVEPTAAKWVGFPCLQSFPAGLPVNALGNVDINGAYAANMWSICNCQAIKPPPPPPVKPPCKGPFCDLFGSKAAAKHAHAKLEAGPRSEGSDDTASSSTAPANKGPKLPLLALKPPVLALPQIKPPNITLPPLNLAPQLDALKAGAAAKVDALKEQLGAAAAKAPPALLAQIDAVKSQLNATGGRGPLALPPPLVAIKSMDTIRGFANGTIKVPLDLQAPLEKLKSQIGASAKLPVALQQHIETIKAKVQDATTPAAIAAQLDAVRAFANATTVRPPPALAAQLEAWKIQLNATAAKLPPGVLEKLEGMRAQLQAAKSTAKNLTLPSLPKPSLPKLPSLPSLPKLPSLPSLPKLPQGLQDMESYDVIDSLTNGVFDMDDLRDSMRLEAILHAASVHAASVPEGSHGRTSSSKRRGDGGGATSSGNGGGQRKRKHKHSGQRDAASSQGKATNAGDAGAADA